MAPNTRSGQNTVDPANQEGGGETGGEFIATGNSYTPNPTLMPGFTAEQASSLQAMMSAQIATSNKAIMDQMQAMNDRLMAAINAKNGSEQQQVMAPVNPRFVNTPTPQPPDQSHLHSNQQPNQQSNQQPNTSQSSPHDEQPPPADDTTTARWRGEELGTFDPAVDDVYTFTDRMHQVAGLRGHLLVQLNVSLQLKGLAKSWYEMELGPSDKAMLCEARSIHAWVNALIQRFRPAAADVLHQLEKAYYTRNDAAAKKDPVAFLHEILRLTRHDNRPDHERLTIAYIHFESQLRISLIAPRYDTSISEFIEQLEGKKHAWYETYYLFGKRKDYFPSDPAPSQQGNDQRPPQRQQWSRNSQQQWPRNSGAQQQWPRNTVLQPTNSTPPPNRGPQQQQRLLPAPPGANAYFGDPQHEQDDDDEWQYDPPTDSYVAAPTFQPPGHTPRRYGNTHDGGGREAQANWASAGDDHRCTHDGCTHYH